MTRKDYQLIADVIRTSYSADVYKDLRWRLAMEFADALAATNPRFDRERFLKACNT